ncbi:MAG TPA: glycosyltransferase family 2 protein [Gemmatimonadaceae bacterium]|nr:glycosyltransferase family 2 protein [Gemmatimonadaceae bacterium]
MSSDPRISVVIPAHNAVSTLQQSLDSVFANRGVTYEVLLVNDASTDATEELTLKFPARVVSLAKNIMSANCRNLGAQLARGEIVVFFDADQLMEPDTLARYAAALDANPGVTAVVGSLAADTPMPGFFSRFKNFQHHYTHQTADREGATLASGLVAIRRDAFLKLGGFEPAFSGASIEDIALGYRMVREGHRIRFEPSIQIVHLKGYTFRQMVRSDILHRAIPWTGLMLREKMYRSDLNTRSGNVASVVFAWLIPLFAMAGLLGLNIAWIGAGAAAATIAFLNAPFLGAARREFGLWFALRSAAFLPVMYFYHGVGLLAGIATYLRGGSVAKRRAPPEPIYQLREGQQVRSA